MKRYIVILFIIFLFIPLGKSGPKLKFISNTISLGELYFEENSIDFSVKYTNIGDSPLYITSVSPSCLCMKAKYADDALMPGDTTAIQIHFVFWSDGEFYKNIVVQYHDEDIEDPSESITIYGIIKNELEN